ncbi:universal stress protein [Neobacillus mesonae]|uniref:Universal stress protein n=1 Tax=Neobacillus mesonae TaxID=1193713 RepID=A0A3T0I2J3_9BACI|nr:universal stress protein [Neobacillus mesonae]AZU63570.1 universal stress protein [Neobacillus mesonae]MED4203113.1 universal stress protein [Neobacillus mesonae]
MLTVYSRIVVPYDGSALSQKALEMAIKLTEQDKRIELDVLTVVNKEITGKPVYNLELEQETQRKAAAELQTTIKEKLASLPNRTRTIVLDGNPPQMILEFVKQNGSDLIIMGSRGLSVLKELHLGSVSHHVVQKATCPVLIVK